MQYDRQGMKRFRQLPLSEAMEIDMWTVVFMSQDKSKTDKILKLLEENKIMTMLKTSSEGDFEVDNVYEILVPQTELETAQDIIFDFELES